MQYLVSLVDKNAVMSGRHLDMIESTNGISVIEHLRTKVLINTFDPSSVKRMLDKFGAVFQVEPAPNSPVRPLLP